MKTRETLIACAIAAAVAVAVVACGGEGNGLIEITTGTVIRNVTVVNTRDGSLASGMAVVVDGGKIQKIASSGIVRTSGTAQDVDATGKYVVPGFLDMHTHTIDAADLQPTNWPLLIANGITACARCAVRPPSCSVPNS